MSILDHYNFEADYYEKLYGDYRGDINTIESLMPNGRILEIFCGTGRIISNLRGGVGIDNNYRMLINGRNFRKVLGDVFCLPFKQVFNFVIVGLNSLLLFKNDEKNIIIREINMVTQRGGRVFLDVLNGFSLKQEEFVVSEYRYNNEFIKLTLLPERVDDTYILHYKYHIKNSMIKIEKRELIIYPIEYVDLKEMLERNDFYIKRMWGDYDLSPYSNNSEKMLIEAVKKD